MSTEDLEKIGMKALGKVLSNTKNISILSSILLKDKENYKRNIYQIVGDILKKEKLKTILDNIRNNKICWEHFTYDDISFLIKEQEDFIINPFVVEEGVIQCKCGSRRVFSYSKSTRSSDEALSVFSQCVECKSKWVFSG